MARAQENTLLRHASSQGLSPPKRAHLPKSTQLHMGLPKGKARPRGQGIALKNPRGWDSEGPVTGGRTQDRVGQKVRMPGSPARSRGYNSPPVSLPPANGLTRAQGPHSLKGSGCQHHCPRGPRCPAWLCVPPGREGQQGLNASWALLATLCALARVGQPASQACWPPLQGRAASPSCQQERLFPSSLG